MAFTSAETEDLKVARNLLENPGLAVKISNVIGSPIEKGFASIGIFKSASILKVSLAL